MVGKRAEGRKTSEQLVFFKSTIVTGTILKEGKVL